MHDLLTIYKRLQYVFKNLHNLLTRFRHIELNGAIREKKTSAFFLLLQKTRTYLEIINHRMSGAGNLLI